MVKPKVGDYWLPKTLLDGGSSINILYLDTFRRLRLPQSMIETTHTTFHGIVPGRKAYPIGKVTLPVTFGTPTNFRTERDRKSTRLNSSHPTTSRMPSSA